MAETSIAALDHHTLGRVLEMVCDEATQARLPYVCKQFRDVAISTGRGLFATAHSIERSF